MLGSGPRIDLTAAICASRESRVRQDAILPTCAIPTFTPLGALTERVTIGIWLFPPAGTLENRVIREEGELLRKAFPEIDFDHLGARTISPARNEREGRL